MKYDVGSSKTLAITVQQQFNDVTQVRHQAEKIINYNCFTHGNYRKVLKRCKNSYEMNSPQRPKGIFALVANMMSTAWSRDSKLIKKRML